MVKLDNSCPVCGGDMNNEGQADEKVRPLWRNIVCSEICYIQLSRRAQMSGNVPEPVEGNPEAVVEALGEQTAGRVIPFTGKSRRTYNRPGAAHRLHLPAHHSADSIAPLIRLAESSGPDSSFTHMVMGSMLHSVGAATRRPLPSSAG